MANMVDYLAWRGDVSFEASPWNEIDGLLIATISYLDFHGGVDAQGWTLEEMARIELLQTGNSASFPGRKAAFEGMAASERFRGCRQKRCDYHHRADPVGLYAFIQGRDQEQLQEISECSDAGQQIQKYCQIPFKMR